MVPALNLMLLAAFTYLEAASYRFVFGTAGKRKEPVISRLFLI
jgi:hypothetical protein